MFTQFGNVNVHATSVKVIIVYPNSFEGEVTFQNFVDVSTEQTEQFGLFGGEFSTLIVDCQYLFLGIECKPSYLYIVTSFPFLPFTRRKMASIRNTNSSILNGLVM